LDRADIQGHLAIYVAKQLTMGLKEKTVKSRLSVLELLRSRGANLLDPYWFLRLSIKPRNSIPKKRD
jgi:hypothetical protein